MCRTPKKHITDKIRKEPSPLKELKPGQKVLVYFPVNTCTKLFSNWKGVYEIKEQLDVNSYIVSELGQSRRKYIVGRNRIRIIGEPPITELLSENTPEFAENDHLVEGENEPPTTGQIDQGVQPENPEEGNVIEDTLEEKIPEITPPEYDKCNQDNIDFDVPAEIADDINEEQLEETEIPIEVIPLANQRPRRRAKDKARGIIKGWTDNLAD